MKKVPIKTIISAIFCAIILIITGNCHGQIKQDKIYHGITGVSISGGTVVAQKYLLKQESNPIWPTITVCTIAATKEMYDSFKGGRFSGSDFAVTAISGAITNLVLGIILKPNKGKNQIIKDPFDWENDPLVRHE